MVTDLRKEGCGAEALLPPVSQAGPGPSDVLWFSFAPHCPVSPPLLPTPLPSHRCLVERPRTEHLLAIQGEVPRARQQVQEAGAVAGAGGLWLG